MSHPLIGLSESLRNGAVQPSFGMCGTQVKSHPWPMHHKDNFGFTGHVRRWSSVPATARGRNSLTSHDRRYQKSSTGGMATLAVALSSQAKVAFIMHLTRLVLQTGGCQASIILHGGSKGAKPGKKRRAWASETGEVNFLGLFSPAKHKPVIYFRHPLY